MLNKKGLTLTELVELLIAFLVIVGLLFLIIKLVQQPESQTLNSFKTLGSEIKLLLKELEGTDKAEVTVPVYIEKDKAISAVNKDSQIYPEQCKGKSCLQLYERESMKVINVIPFDNTEFKQEAHIKTSESKIVNVKLTAEKTDSKKIITLEQIT